MFGSHQLTFPRRLKEPRGFLIPVAVRELYHEGPDLPTVSLHFDWNGNAMKAVSVTVTIVLVKDCREPKKGNRFLVCEI